MKSTIKHIYVGGIGLKVGSEASSVEVKSEPAFFNDNANNEHALYTRGNWRP